MLTAVTTFLGSALGKGIMVAAGIGLLSLVGKCAWDGHVAGIREGERLQIENAAGRARIENIERKRETDDKVRASERLAKVWCQAGRRECCDPAGARGLQQCAQDPGR